MNSYAINSVSWRLGTSGISGVSPANERQQELEYINKIDYNIAVNGKEFKRWLTQQGATFGSQKGSHLKVYLNGKQSIIPMHNTDLKTGTAEAIKKQLGLK